MSSEVVWDVLVMLGGLVFDFLVFLGFLGFWGILVLIVVFGYWIYFFCQSFDSISIGGYFSGAVLFYFITVSNFIWIRPCGSTSKCSWRCVG